MLPTWDDGYPDQTRLRHEVMSMAQSIVDVLLESIPRGAIKGIYLKGSAIKRWDSPIDYVPEISDVDLHIALCDDDAWREHLGTVAQALEVQRRVESRYLSKVSGPLHTPRPQLVDMNRVIAELDVFVHSPRKTVTVMYGEEYPLGDYGESAPLMREESDRLVENADYLTQFPIQLVDKPGRYTENALRSLVWRVSPAGPRVLHISGVDMELAWDLNRTGVVSTLFELGHDDIAKQYAEFYLAGWRYFLSGFENADAGRDAITAAVEVISMGAEVAKAWLASQNGGQAP